MIAFYFIVSEKSTEVSQSASTSAENSNKSDQNSQKSENVPPVPGMVVKWNNFGYDCGGTINNPLSYVDADYSLIRWYTNEIGQWMAVVGAPIWNSTKKSGIWYMLVPVNELIYVRTGSLAIFDKLSNVSPSKIANDVLKGKKNNKKLKIGVTQKTPLSHSWMQTWRTAHPKKPRNKSSRSTSNGKNKNKKERKSKNSGNNSNNKNKKKNTTDK